VQQDGEVTGAFYDVAILGAGPTGLTLANLLGQAGCRVALVERNTTTVQEPRAVSIDDEALRTMQAISLADAVIRDVALDYGAHYFTPAATRFLTVEPTTREYGFPRRNAFTQPKLEATLRTGVQRFPNVTAMFGHACEDIAANEDGVVLTLRDPEGRTTTLRANYLAGCDGARSVVRKIIGATLTGATYQQRWLIVDLASTKERLRQTRVVCNPARPLITLPGPDGIRRYEFMLHDGEDEAAATAPDFVRGLLAAHGPDADAPIVRRQVYTFHARVADRWQLGRIFIAGDAAHLSPPFAGQGMNSGIRDAHNLGWKLAKVVAGELGPGVLETYQVEREPHARALIDLAINIGRVMMPTSRAQAFLVQAGFRLARLAPGLQSYFAEMKYKPKPFYRNGFVVSAADAPAVVGRMLPQPAVERRDRSRAMLDDLLGSGFALVACGPQAQRALADAVALNFGMALPVALAILPPETNADNDAPSDIETVRDVGGILTPFVPAGRTIVMLVRPDHYVAAAAYAGAASLAAMADATRDLIAATSRDQRSDIDRAKPPAKVATARFKSMFSFATDSVSRSGG
jgi:3-(3-hydroxy-phenyl)propionate hydroxylase